MARLFDDAASDYAEYAGAVLAAAPLAVSLWFYSDSIALTQCLFSIGRSGTANNYFALLAAGASVGDPVRLAAKTASGVQNADTTSGYSANTWTHAAGICASATDRRVFHTGANKGTNTTSRAPASLNVTNIGCLTENTRSMFHSGRVAAVGLWDLTSWGSTDTERGDNFEKVIPSLARGVLPTSLPLGLVAYWPLYGIDSPEPDLHLIGGTRYPMTLSGTVQANHAPVVPYSARRWGSVPEIGVAAAGGRVVSIINGGLTQSGLAGGSLVR